MYIFQFILLSTLGNFRIEYQNISIFVDFSSINLTFIGIPALIMGSMVYSFYTRKKDFNMILVTLFTIKNQSRSNSKKKTKAYIIENLERNNISDLKIFNDIFHELEYGKYPYIQRRNNRYQLTLLGRKLIKKYGKNSIIRNIKQDYIDIKINELETPLQVWSEEDFKRSGNE